MNVHQPLLASLVMLLATFTPVSAAEYQAKVTRVLDGDTIEVLHAGAPERIRLSGIDCPEKAQAFGARAKQFSADLCYGKVVTVQDRGRDRYGRTLGEVRLPDGRDLNHELVNAGMAWWYRKYAANDVLLWSLEQDARQERRGLWADSNPASPWAWRHDRAQVLVAAGRPRANVTHKRRLGGKSVTARFP